MSDIIILADNNTSTPEIHENNSSAFSMDKIDEWLISRQKIKLEKKVIFFRLLATMVNAGLSVIKAISILEKQEKNPVLKRAYEAIIIGIK